MKVKVLAQRGGVVAFINTEGTIVNNGRNEYFVHKNPFDSKVWNLTEMKTRLLVRGGFKTRKEAIQFINAVDDRVYETLKKFDQRKYNEKYAEVKGYYTSWEVK